ncbi:CoxG family protein [Acidimangrovimonas pyrenivorans]|uniref:CoxG family protein n=1 Tax=Acidimangrovimonas pyrenivorans TaxID=2030798 RepID=A0ABV7AJ26_9RHOB
MRFEGDYLVPAAPEKVWEGLNDPEVLRRSIPGCSAMERTGDNEFTASVTARVGPVSATFKGKVELADLDPPTSYTLRGRGQGGPAGFAKGAARITLAPEGSGTRLRYEADVDIGGKLASVGGRLIQGVARKTADDFFAGFAKVLTGEAPAAAAPAGAAPTAGAARVAIAAHGGHIPLIDRVAWLISGFALGLLAAYCFG